ETSTSPISLLEHRVLFGVGHELPDLLGTAAGDGDLRGPLECLLAGGHVDDRESADVLFGLGVLTVHDRPISGRNARPLAFQPAAETPHACVYRLLHHLVRGPTHVGNVIGRDVIHRAVIERDQVSRHLMTPVSRRPPPATAHLCYERAAPDPTLARRK